jgi:hypothetical protein
VLYDLRPPGEDHSAPEKICDVYLGMDESIYPCIILPLVYIGGGEEPPIGRLVQNYNPWSW